MGSQSLFFQGRNVEMHALVAAVMSQQVIFLFRGRMRMFVIVSITSI